MNSISICIIVKNEEKYITDFLQSSIKFADEIIVLDTGSTDNTKKIVKSFSKTKLYETIWEDDNAKARNLCISYATCEWIIVLDADEILSIESENNIKNFIEDISIKYPHDYIFQFKSLNQNPYSPEKEYFKSTLFRNNQNIRYTRVIHDYPTLQGKITNYIKCHNMTIIHNNGSTYKHLSDKNLKYIDRMNTEINKNPDSIEKYYYYKHIGDSYLFLKESEKALNFYFKSETLALHINSNKDFLLELYYRIKNILIKNEDNYPLLITYLTKIKEIAPLDNFNILSLGYISLFLGEYNISINYYNQIRDKTTNNKLRADIYTGLARAQLMLGFLKDSLNNFKLAYDLFPSDELSLHLARAYVAVKQVDKALFLLKKSGFNLSSNNLKLQISEYDVWTNAEKESLLC